MNRKLKSIITVSIAGAVGVSFVGIAFGRDAAAWSAGDHAIIAPGTNLPVICAKSRTACKDAVDAIHSGDATHPPRWQIEKDYNTCVPHPGCFTERSNCIPNFNC